MWTQSLSGSAWTLCSDMKLPLLICPLQAPWKSSWASRGLDISHGKLPSRLDSSLTHTQPSQFIKEVRNELGFWRNHAAFSSWDVRSAPCRDRRAQAGQGVAAPGRIPCVVSPPSQVLFFLMISALVQPPVPGLHELLELSLWPSWKTKFWLFV